MWLVLVNNAARVITAGSADEGPEPKQGQRYYDTAFLWRKWKNTLFILEGGSELRSWDVVIFLIVFILKRDAFLAS